MISIIQIQSNLCQSQPWSYFINLKAYHSHFTLILNNYNPIKNHADPCLLFHSSYFFISRPGDFFTLLIASFKSYNSTGSGMIASYLGLGWNFRDLWCYPLSTPSSWNSSFLKGRIAAYLHTKRISEPEYP